MRDYDRAILLERIEREGATIGASIPIELDVEGEHHRIRAPILGLVAEDELSEEQRALAGSLASILRRARKERYERLDRGDCDFETGERLVEEITGIDRARTTLNQLDSPGVAEQAAQRERADRQRWLAFLKEALGHEQGRRR